MYSIHLFIFVDFSLIKVGLVKYVSFLYKKKRIILLFPFFFFSKKLVQ